jgi:Bacterial Ig domain
MKKLLIVCFIILTHFAFAQDTVWSEDFESIATGAKYFNIGSTKILSNGGVNNSKCVEVEYERYDNGGTPRYLHKQPITPATEYTLSYDIYFDNDWTISTGGKYHGLVPENTTSGCAPIEQDGWSARVVFDDRQPYLYTYHQDKNATCGDKTTDKQLQLTRAKWYAVSLHLKLNSADNVNDGFAKIYINGELIATQSNREFRSIVNNATKITQFYFCTFLGAGPTGAIKTLSHARFDNFGVYPGQKIRNAPGGIEPVNIKPTVSLTAPANNSTFTAPASVTLSANAADSDGSISKVEFYNGSILLASDAIAPYIHTWQNVAAGTYSLTLKATDNSGAATTSNAINIIVTTPTCSISSNIRINNGTWIASNMANAKVGDTVQFGPQSSSTGSTNVPGWSWTGPNNFAQTGREVIITNIKLNQGGTYIVSYTDPNGCKATQSINVVVSNPTTTSTITASAGANGAITPLGVISVINGTNKTFAITPNNGFQIDVVKVNGASVGAVASYTFTNVTSNQTIAATFKTVVVQGGGACLLSNFGVPRTAALPDKNTSYNKVYTLGTGAPNLSNVTSAVINWSLANNGLYQLSFNTSNGNPAWWLDMKSSVQNFAQSNPAITFSGTGITNLDGNKYYTNYVDGGNVVFVEIAGKHAIYFSNSTTPPAGCVNTLAISSNAIQEVELHVFPNPSIDGNFRLSKDCVWELRSSTGLKLGQGEGTIVNIGAEPKGTYFIITESKVIRIVKD